MSLLVTIAKGAAWATGAQWVVQFTQFGTSIVLARMLSPRDYGLVGLALVYTGFVSLFLNLGMGPALIQRKVIDDGHICAAFWGSAALSLVLFMFSVIAAPTIAGFFNEAELPLIIRVTAIALLLSPLNAILYSLLTRRMAFRSLAMLDVVAAVVSQGTALFFALAGWGVWSIVIAQIVHPLVRLPLLLHLNHWLPSLRFDRERFADLFSFSSHVIGFNFVNYFARNVDKVIIGKLLGPAALGLYDMGYQIMLKPLQNVSLTISAPLLPVLSSLQGDHATSSHVYRRVAVYIAVISYPMMLGIALVADDFVILALGQKWAAAVPIIQILCLVGAIQSVGSTTGDVYLSQGRSDIMLKWTLATTPFVVAAFVVGSRWGVTGVAAAYAAISLPLWVISHEIANRLISLNSMRFWTSFLPVVAMCGAMAAAVIATQALCDLQGLGRLPRLVAAITSGIIAYSCLLYVSTNPDITAVRDRVREHLRKRFGRNAGNA